MFSFGTAAVPFDISLFVADLFLLFYLDTDTVQCTVLPVFLFFFHFLTRIQRREHVISTLNSIENMLCMYVLFTFKISTK